MTTDLYRCFDKDDVLIYVGVSFSTIVRLQQHKKSSFWFSKVAIIKREIFQDRKTALASERKAIREEKPVFNKHGINKYPSGGDIYYPINCCQHCGKPLVYSLRCRVEKFFCSTNCRVAAYRKRLTLREMQKIGA